MKIRNFLKKMLAVVLALAMLAPIMGDLEVNVKKVNAEETTFDDSLNVKCQVTQGVVTDTSIDKYRGNYVIRFVSAIQDYTDYKEIGFKVLETGQTQEKTAKVKTVFKRIESTTGSTATEKETYTFSPKVVNTDSEYFLTAKLPVAPEKMDVNYTVWAYGIKTDGTLVAGQKRCVSVSDGLETCETINMSFENKSGADLTNVTSLTVNDTYTASVIDVDGTTVHVRISGVPTPLKSATKFTFKKGNDEVGSEILRNLYTKYTGSGTADTSWYEEYYSADNNQKEFTIATSADLYGFAALTNSTNNQLGAKQTFEGKKIYLVSDIVVNDEVLVSEHTDANYMKWISPDTNEPVDETTLYAWQPISIDASSGFDNSFKGLFDGQMHSISGINCSVSQYGTGFFCRTYYTAEIKNFELLNSYFENDSYCTGSVVGEVYGTILDKVYSDAIVKVTKYPPSGGLVGRAYSANMNQCWFDGVVSNVSTSVVSYGTGGLIGQNNEGTLTITNSLNTGYIHHATTDSYAETGGLVGTDYGSSKITIKNCLNAGTINATDGAHIIGVLRTANMEIEDSYSYGGKHVVGYFSSSTPFKVLSQGEEVTPTKYDSYRWKVDAITSSDTPSSFLGEAARNNMPGFAFDTTWSIVQNENPVLQVFESEVIDTSWYDEDEDTYVLYDKADLWGFSALSQETDFAGKTIKLGNDIVINTGVATNWGTTAPKYAWTPASSSIPFTGTFDGGMHTISGLYMNSASECSGFFSKTAETAVIKNVNVENSYFTSTKPALGSIIGEGCGRLENVYSNAIVTGSDGHIGGLIGRVQGTKANLRYCWYEGTVINTATTTGTANEGRGTGGLIGCTKGATELDNCLNKGAVDVRAYTGSIVPLAGGLVGYVNTGGLIFTDCLNTGGVLVAEGSQGGYFVGYYTVNMTCTTSYGYGSNDYAMGYPGQGGTTTVNYISGGQSASGTNDRRDIPITVVSETDITGDAAATKLAGFDFVNTWQTVDGGTPVLNFSTDLENMDKRWYDTTATEYTLYDKGDLYGFADISKTYNFSGKTVKLGDDIVLNEGVAKNWGTNPHSKSWAPIGIETCLFRGTFDGNMHTISGLYMNTTVKGSGLFGITGPEAVIRNVKLTNSYFESTARELGSIVGRLRGKVYMVYSDAIMKSANTMYGGIAGITCGSDVELENCWYAGSITTIENQNTAFGIGGIVGCATAENTESQLTIRNCLNTANFDITTYTVQYPCTGGIVGRVYHNGDEKIPDVEIDSCLNTGTFTTNSDVKVGYAAIVGYVDNKEEYFKAKVQIYRTYATEAMDNAFNVDSTGIYVVDARAIQGSGAEATMPLLGWGTDWKCGEEGKFPEIIFSTSGYGEGVTATQEEQEMLASYYADRVLYQGDIHGHAKTYGNGSVSAVYGDDGKVDLATWAQDIQNKTVDLDFAASLDHHQATHYDLTVWQENLNKFIYGTEAGTIITDLGDAGGKKREMDYNMLFPNKDALLNVLTHNDFVNKFQYGSALPLRDDYFAYPNFTKEEMKNLMQVVRDQGGFFVHAHPTTSSYSTNTLDYYFTDHTGFEVFFTPADADAVSHPNGAYGSPETLGHYRVWDELLKAGKRLYATAGSDTHGALNTYAVTSVYSGPEAANDKGEIITQLRAGDFVAGAVGMQMCIGDTVMGGTRDFDGQKLIVDINKFHSSVIKEGHRYRVDILNEKGVVLRQMVTPEQGLSIAMNVDANSKYYRVEVTDLTNKYLIAIGNPIWNAKFINAE